MTGTVETSRIRAGTAIKRLDRAATACRNRQEELAVELNEAQR